MKPCYWLNLCCVLPSLRLHNAPQTGKTQEAFGLLAFKIFLYVSNISKPSVTIKNGYKFLTFLSRHRV
jgi:hypothetical protein